MKKSTTAKPSKKARYLDVKTFTYFIPTPPRRKSGYREREFDKIMHGILSEGHEIIDWKLQSVNDGLYAIFLLGTHQKKLAGPALDLHERHGLSAQPTNSDFELLNDED